MVQKLRGAYINERSRRCEIFKNFNLILLKIYGVDTINYFITFLSQSLAVSAPGVFLSTHSSL